MRHSRICVTAFVVSLPTQQRAMRAMNPSATAAFEQRVFLLLMGFGPIACLMDRYLIPFETRWSPYVSFLSIAMLIVFVPVLQTVRLPPPQQLAHLRRTTFLLQLLLLVSSVLCAVILPLLWNGWEPFPGGARFTPLLTLAFWSPCPLATLAIIVVAVHRFRSSRATTITTKPTPALFVVLAVFAAALTMRASYRSARYPAPDQWFRSLPLVAILEHNNHSETVPLPYTRNAQIHRESIPSGGTLSVIQDNTRRALDDSFLRMQSIELRADMENHVFVGRGSRFRRWTIASFPSPLFRFRKLPSCSKQSNHEDLLKNCAPNSSVETRIATSQPPSLRREQCNLSPPRGWLLLSVLGLGFAFYLRRVAQRQTHDLRIGTWIEASRTDNGWNSEHGFVLDALQIPEAITKAWLLVSFAPTPRAQHLATAWSPIDPTTLANTLEHAWNQNACWVLACSSAPLAVAFAYGM